MEDGNGFVLAAVGLEVLGRPPERTRAVDERFATVPETGRGLPQSVRPARPGDDGYLADRARSSDQPSDGRRRRAAVHDHRHCGGRFGPRGGVRRGKRVRVGQRRSAVRVLHGRLFGFDRRTVGGRRGSRVIPLLVLQTGSGGVFRPFDSGRRRFDRTKGLGEQRRRRFHYADGNRFRLRRRLPTRDVQKR